MFVGINYGEEFFTCQMILAKKMGISERLKEERTRMGLTQPAMAELIGATKRSVINWEGGTGSPNAEAMAAIAAAGADVQYILTGVHSSNALSPTEQVLLERYRNSSKVIQDAALRVLLTGESGGGMVVHGSVGQRMEAPMNGGSITINMGNTKK